MRGAAARKEKPATMGGFLRRYLDNQSIFNWPALYATVMDANSFARRAGMRPSTSTTSASSIISKTAAVVEDLATVFLLVGARFALGDVRLTVVRRVVS